jgi:hypothetical protein
MKRGLTRLWYKFKNWFRTKPGRESPLTFLCGSEEELRRVTTWICHVRTPLFAENTLAVIVYGSFYDPEAELEGVLWATEDKKGNGCMLGEPQAECDYSRVWCSWVLQYNKFQGTEWVRGTYIGWEEIPLQISVKVYPPSAHERAEALLALSEWLDGKVSEQEKRELLQLPDDVEV